jgi:hypothetical protein
MIKSNETPPVINVLQNALERIDPHTTTHMVFQRRLEDAFQNLGEGRLSRPRLYFADHEQLLLGGQDLSMAFQALERIEERPLQAIADTLQDVINHREEQDELWPEGRLQLGITLEAMGSYVQARQVFEEVIQICENNGRFKNSAMAMAA